MHDYAPSSSKVALHSVPGDPIEVQMHTLANGLRLYLTVNRDEPRVYTEIAVRAGSKHDPADTTGLAHYFEHMMFKGTDRLGSLDWPKEKALLDRIEQKFEEHRAEQDPQKKKVLYAEIDRLSFEAAKFAAANEYDKLVSAIGAKGTNAYTWVEQTVYVNDIPSNELERWFSLESERFRRPILRLFHTELETVFEEYNISQDKDFRKTMKAMQETLTPTHPYGTQTTLGRGEDLKNPSQTNIYRFFDRYYVPNNMAIVLSGDFDPEQAVALAEQHFGHYKAKPIPEFHFGPQPELSSRVHRDVYGNEASWVEMGWRFPGANSQEAMLLPLIAHILYNHQAGLLDLNVTQKQKLLEAYAYPRVYEDFSSLFLYGKPREEQSLEAVEKILLEQIENLRNGHFEDWLPGAVVKDMKLSEIKTFEKNVGRAGAITNAFVLGITWPDMVQRWEKLEKVTKADVVAFARKHLRPDNYAVVFKHYGDDAAVMKVDKPPITPIEVNRTDVSGFARDFLEADTPDIVPQFIDFQKAIKRSTINKHLKLHAVQEPGGQLFRLHYTFDMGRLSDRRLALIASYIPYLGTSRCSATEMQQAFYRLGVSISASCQDEQFHITLAGLDESFEDAVALLEELLADAQPDAEALSNLVADILLRRENDKKDKRIVLTKAMASYAKYGPLSPFSDKLTKEQLLAIRPEELTDLLHNLLTFKHEVFYYGARSVRTAANILKKYHGNPTPDGRGAATSTVAFGATSPLPLGEGSGVGSHALLPAKKYPELSSRKDKVFFVHYPMVQVELLLLSKGTPKFSLDEYVFSEWYNQYFGYGLSSIVFQDIRESKALAYSAYAYSAIPARKNRAHYLQSYVGTQPDKLREAIEAFETILEDMPVSLPQMENARQSVLKQIAAGRITKAEIYWTWRANRDRGFANRDLRADVYHRLENADAADLIHYQQRHVKGRHYTWLVMGDRQQIDFKYLRKIGKVQELTMEEVFGY
ncbi:MAG: insulinase family protein [Saprospiraceae bacterium]|nr:insulinase family protein [Saprospiraceae bacterium]